MKMISKIGMMLFLLALSGCARPFSDEALKLVDASLSYQQVRDRPGDYRGKFITAGGVVAAVYNTNSGGELEILQFPLDGSGRPDPAALSSGRFLALTDSFLDPLLFQPGLMASVVGEIAGEETRELEGVDYRYPLLRIREVHIWKPGESTKPVIHFGIGIGTVF
jgi:outer membrane lipoprotein